LLLEFRSTTTPSISGASSQSALSPPTAGSVSPPPNAAVLRGQLKRRFVRCSSLTTVTHLKKFIAKKLLSTTDKYKDVEILCNEETLYKDHTLKFVYVTQWRTKDPPMRLQYIPKESPSAPES